MMRGIKGFMFIELVMVIITLVILLIVVVPRYLDLKKHSNIYWEGQIVGSVKSGIQVYSSNACEAGSCTYPDALDSAAAGACKKSNPCFGNVLSNVVTEDWAKVSPTAYIGPTGTTYTYTQDPDGAFQ